MGSKLFGRDGLNTEMAEGGRTTGWERSRDWVEDFADARLRDYKLDRRQLQKTEEALETILDTDDTWWPKDKPRSLNELKTVRAEAFRALARARRRARGVERH